MPSENNLEKYNEFISLLELSKINLDSLYTEKNKNFAQKQVSLDIAMDYEVKDAKQIDLEVFVPFSFTVKAFVNEDNEEKNINSIKAEDTLFTIKMELMLTYFLDIEEIETTDITVDYSDILEQFAERNVVINAWPYVREMVHSLTFKMGLPALVIPLKKFPLTR
jgi:preprotein translocase subunit SecB